MMTMMMMLMMIRVDFQRIVLLDERSNQITDGFVQIIRQLHLN